MELVQSSATRIYYASIALRLGILVLTVAIPLILTVGFGITSIFVPLLLVHLWWHLPISTGYFPFFWKEIMYRRDAVMVLAWIMFVWPIAFSTLAYVDLTSDYAVTKILLGAISIPESATISVILPVASSLLRHMVSRWLRKVEVFAYKSVQSMMPMVGMQIHFRFSPETLWKGFPILVKNGLRIPIAISNIVFQMTTSSIPIDVLRRARDRDYNEITVQLDSHEKIEAGRSELITIDWKELSTACAMAERIRIEKRKPVRFFISLYDPFQNKEFRTSELNAYWILSSRAFANFRTNEDSEWKEIEVANVGAYNTVTFARNLKQQLLNFVQLLDFHWFWYKPNAYYMRIRVKIRAGAWSERIASLTSNCSPGNITRICDYSPRREIEKERRDYPQHKMLTEAVFLTLVGLASSLAMDYYEQVIAMFGRNFETFHSNLLQPFLKRIGYEAIPIGPSSNEYGHCIRLEQREPESSGMGDLPSELADKFLTATKSLAFDIDIFSHYFLHRFLGNLEFHNNLGDLRTICVGRIC